MADEVMTPHQNYLDLLKSLEESYKELKKYCGDRVEENKIVLKPETDDFIRKLLDFQIPQNLEYAERLAQHLFRIRFTYVNAYGYRKMFLELLKMMGKNRANIPVKILSIGCGNGIDCWAVHEARRMYDEAQETAAGQTSETKKNKIYLNYTGVDKYSWDQPYFQGGQYVDYRTSENISDFLSNQSYLKQNVILFAKVLNELDDEEHTFSKMCDIFKTIDFKYKDAKSGSWKYSNRVYFLFFLRTRPKKDGDYGFWPDDIEKINKLQDALGHDRNGYHFKPLHYPTTFRVKEKGQDCPIDQCGEDFGYIYNQFYAPETDSGSYIDLLLSRTLDRSPMRHMHNIGYQIFTFVREEQA